MNLIVDVLYENANLMFDTGFAMMFLPVVIWVESYAYKLVSK